MEVVGLIAFFAAIVLGIRTVYAIKTRSYLHKERMRALELGKTDMDMGMEKVERERPRNHQTMALHGVIWTGIGLGLIVAAFVLNLIVEDPDFRDFAAFLVIWSFPSLFVGIGLNILAGKAREEEREREERARREAANPPYVPPPPAE